jgi:hypothetical protein
VRFDVEVLDAFLRRIYEGFDTDTSIEEGVWRELLRIINEATVEGLTASDTPPTHDKLFLEELRHGNEVFAAFKTHAMGVEMAAKLIDEKGNLKPFYEWKRDVQEIATHQVHAWLQTEYNTAVLRAHAAADWREFERNKDVMPNLRWMKTTSPNPESSHRFYWESGICLPVDDPFWNDHHPGDRWNCKCSLMATDEPVVRPVDPFNPDPPQRGLENNPGKDGHLFSQNHPYFPKSCSECAFNTGVTNRVASFFGRGKNCHSCKKVDKRIPRKVEEPEPGKERGVSALIKQYYAAESRREQVEILQKIVSSNDFKKLDRYSTRDGSIYRMTEKKLTEGEMPKNLAIAQKLLRFHYDVYLLPNPGDSKSADFVIRREGKLYYFEAKTYNGRNSLDTLLSKGAKQSERVVVNIIQENNPNHVSEQVVKIFEKAPNLTELVFLKGSRMISATRRALNSPDFKDRFRKEWNKNK